MDKRIKHGKLKGRILFYLNPERRMKFRILKEETRLTASELVGELIDEAYRKYHTYKEGEDRTGFIATLLSRAQGKLDQMTTKK